MANHELVINLENVPWLTKEEKAVINSLLDACKALVEMGDSVTTTDLDDFYEGIMICSTVVANASVRRIIPEAWKGKEDLSGSKKT